MQTIDIDYDRHSPVVINCVLYASYFSNFCFKIIISGVSGQL